MLSLTKRVVPHSNCKVPRGSLSGKFCFLLLSDCLGRVCGSLLIRNTNISPFSVTGCNSRVERQWQQHASMLQRGFPMGCKLMGLQCRFPACFFFFYYRDCPVCRNLPRRAMCADSMPDCWSQSHFLLIPSPCFYSQASLCAMSYAHKQIH